jgi:hypothetical protein
MINRHCECTHEAISSLTREIASTEERRLAMTVKETSQ